MLSDGTTRPGRERSRFLLAGPRAMVAPIPDENDGEAGGPAPDPLPDPTIHPQIVDPCDHGCRHALDQGMPGYTCSGKYCWRYKEVTRWEGI